jgi:hypothetical protein
MTESSSHPDPVLRALRGPLTERVRALKALDSSNRTIDDAVLIRVLELAGPEPEAGGSGDSTASAPRTGTSKELQRRVAEVLSRACSNDAQRLRVVAGLDDVCAERRWICAFALARAGYRNAGVLKVAIEALGQPDGDIRWAAAEILRAPETVADARPLIVSAASSESAMRRKMALYCMRDLNIAETTVVLDALGSPDSGVRLAALAALPKLAGRDPRATHEAVRCLREDEDAGVRRAAAAILGRLRGNVDVARSALEAEAATSTDAHFQRAVSGALEKLNNE